MQIYNYNEEKRNRSDSSVYFRAIFFGVLLSLLLIGSGIGIKLLIRLIIQYWMWVFGLIALFFLIKRFVQQKKLVVQAPE